MIDMQMSAHDEIDIIHAKTRGGQRAHKVLVALEIAFRSRRPHLVVADATVNQNDMMRRAHDIRLETEDQPVISTKGIVRPIFQAVFGCGSFGPWATLYFNSSPEVIRLVVMMYVRYPLSLRNVEDLLAERGIDVSHETVRFWWNRFGPMFAAEIRKKRVAHMRGYPQWRWHLDEAFVKVNGKLCYLWRAVDHEGEVLEAVVTAKRDKAAARKFLKRIMKKYGRPRNAVTDGLRAYSAAMKEIGWPPCQQSRGEFASAVSTTRTGYAAVSKREDAAKIQFSSCPGSQPLQSGAPSRHSPSLQTTTSRRIGRVARSRGLTPAWVWRAAPNADDLTVALTMPLVAMTLLFDYE